MDYTLNVHGLLMDLGVPQVMGILNVTPDSFYAGSRSQTEEAIAARCHQIISEGGTIIDVGACSTRPGAEVASEAEERERFPRRSLRLRGRRSSCLRPPVSTRRSTHLWDGTTERRHTALVPSMS